MDIKKHRLTHASSWCSLTFLRVELIARLNQVHPGLLALNSIEC